MQVVSPRASGPGELKGRTHSRRQASRKGQGTWAGDGPRPHRRWRRGEGGRGGRAWPTAEGSGRERCRRSGRDGGRGRRRDGKRWGVLLPSSYMVTPALPCMPSTSTSSSSSGPFPVCATRRLRLAHAPEALISEEPGRVSSASSVSRRKHAHVWRRTKRRGVSSSGKGRGEGQHVGVAVEQRPTLLLGRRFARRARLRRRPCPSSSPSCGRPHGGACGRGEVSDKRPRETAAARDDLSPAPELSALPVGAGRKQSGANVPDHWSAGQIKQRGVSTGRHSRSQDGSERRLAS